MRIISIIAGLLISWCIFGQNRAEIEKQKEQNRAEMEYARKILNETELKKRDNLNNLLIIDRKIQLHTKYINNLANELRIIEEEIVAARNHIDYLESRIVNIKNEYAEIIYSTYKNRKDYEKLAFIFSSEGFNQAYKRIKYLQQYADYRIKQTKAIEEEKKAQMEEVRKMEALLSEKQVIMENITHESNEMQQEKVKKQSIVNKLNKEEKKLRNQIREKERISNELEAAIRRIIDEDSKKKLSVSVLTPEEKLVSDQFRNNKGKLAWPTEKGIITGSFGMQDHPVLKNVKVNSNGIDITTESGAVARALFDGEVKMVASIPGANKVIIIRHGSYMTMYSNIVDVYVKTGQKVKTKQAIGLIFTNREENNKTVLHLEIWEERTVQDPAVWLSQF